MYGICSQLFKTSGGFTDNFFPLLEDADYNVGEYEEALPEMKLPGKIGTKKLRKIQEKAERKAMREVGDSQCR